MRPLILLLPLLLSACFSLGDVAAQCEAAAREQLAALSPPAELSEFQQLQSEARTERSGGATVRLGLSAGTVTARQAGKVSTWQYACAVRGQEAQIRLAPANTPPGAGAPPAFDLGGEKETDL